MIDFFVLWFALTIIVHVFVDYPGIALIRLRLGTPTEKELKLFKDIGLVKSHLFASCDGLFLVAMVYLIRWTHFF